MTPEPHLTRRRETHRENCWLIYCADMHVGTIAHAMGIPNALNLWTWRAGFDPGSRPGEIKSGTADTFEEARATFEKAWSDFAAKRTEADYQEWHEQQEWTARKYTLRDQGLSVPVR